MSLMSDSLSTLLRGLVRTRRDDLSFRAAFLLPFRRRLRGIRTIGRRPGDGSRESRKREEKRATDGWKHQRRGKEGEVKVELVGKRWGEEGPAFPLFFNLEKVVKVIREGRKR